jgi:hypothetical protein
METLGFEKSKLSRRVEEKNNILSGEQTTLACLELRSYTQSTTAIVISHWP